MSNQNQTVEDFLKAKVLSLATSINKAGEVKVALLKEEMDGAKRELLEVHRRLAEGGGYTDSGGSDSDEEKDGTKTSSTRGTEEKTTSKENVAVVEGWGKSTQLAPPSLKRKPDRLPAPQPTSKKATQQPPPSSTPSRPKKEKEKGRSLPPPPTLQIQVTSGPHDGQLFHLALAKSAPLLLGRSTGKKFKNNGVSLPKDLEVSTTHGKFVLSVDNRTVTFTDTGSTNGSFLYDEKGQSTQMVEGEGVKVKEGVKVRVGASLLGFDLIF